MSAAQLDRDNPWPGLESFEEEARDYFHGREAEAEDLLRRVIDAPLTVLFGKSGLGKTSLLKAGLFPRLREKSFLPVHVRLDIRPEAPGLVEQLRDALLGEIARQRVEAPPFTAGESLWEYLHRADLELWSEQNYPLVPVLVLDQFEEVFTLGERLPERVERFKSDLGDLAENRIPAALASRLAKDPSAAQGLDLRRMAYKVVVTLREDFLPHLEGWRAAVPSLGRVRVRLLPMRPEQALSAVYDTAPHLMDEPLARRIVAFVAAAQEPLGGGEIEPALLSLFCRGLNERRRQQGANRFDEQLLEGAQQGIIADYYRSCVEGLPDSVSRFIESDLITEKGFRNSYAKDDAVPAVLSEEELERLINRRLLRVEERYGTARIELTHDLLTRAVMADRDRRRLEEEKAALAERAEAERQALAAQARTQRRRLMAMAVVALVCVAFAGVAAWQWRQAVQATRVSERARFEAQEATLAAQKALSVTERMTRAAEKARSLAVQAMADADMDRDRAIAAQSEALTQAQRAKESAAREQVARGTSEARRMETESRLVFDDSGKALVKATLLAAASVRSAHTLDGQISLTRFLDLLPRAPLWRRSVARPTDTTAGNRLRAVAMSRDGARIAAISESGPVQILDARTGQPIRSLDVERPEGIRTTLAFSPDGASLVLGCGPRACVVDAATGKILAHLPGGGTTHGDMVWSASFSPDGRHLATSSYHAEEVLVYDVATWQVSARIPAAPGGVFSTAFSPGGAWLATGKVDRLQLWRVGQYETPAAEARTPDIVWSLAFQPDDRELIAAGRGLQTWKIEQGEGNTTRLTAAASKPILAHTVVPVSWHNQQCYAAGAWTAVHLLCGESLDEVLRVPVPSAAAAVSPDARRLFSEQSDGNLVAWTLDAGADTFRVPLGAPLQSTAVAEQGGWLAAATKSGEVAIVGLDSWKERRRLRLPAPADKLNASSDGRWLVAAHDASLQVFDARSWRKVMSTTLEEDVRADFAGDRWLVAVAGPAVVVWEPGSWRERRRLKHDGQVSEVKVSADGRQLATITHWSAGRDEGVHLTRVFDLANGNELGWAYRSGGSYLSKQFLEEEAARRRRAPAGGDTALVREAGRSWKALELQEPNNRRASADGRWDVRIWLSVAALHDAATERVVGSFDHGSTITSVRYVPANDPRWLVTAGRDGTLAVWPLRTDDLTREACTRLRAFFDPKALRELMAEAHADGACE
jgi:WD40 repeat protein